MSKTDEFCVKKRGIVYQKRGVLCLKRWILQGWKSSRCSWFVFKMTIFVLKMMNSALQMMRFVLQMQPAFTGPKLLWQYDQWLDGNGNGSDEPKSEIFYGGDALTLGQNQVSFQHSRILISD